MYRKVLITSYKTKVFSSLYKSSDMVVARNLIKLLSFRSHYHWKWCWNIVTLFTFNKKQNNITWEPSITGNWFCVTEWGRLSSNAIYFYQKKHHTRRRTIITYIGDILYIDLIWGIKNVGLIRYSMIWLKQSIFYISL